MLAPKTFLKPSKKHVVARSLWCAPNAKLPPTILYRNMSERPKRQWHYALGSKIVTVHNLVAWFARIDSHDSRESGDSRGPKKPININNFAGLSRKWVGVKLFMCFPKSPGNLRKRPGQSRDSPGIIPGQSRENFVYVFPCLLVFSWPEIRANRKFEWFGWIGLTRYKNRGLNCEWFARIDSRESRCESPVPLRSTSYSGGMNYGVQFQFWPCPELINVTVAALGGIPQRTDHYRNQLQLQFLLSVELINHYS